VHRGQATCPGRGAPWRKSSPDPYLESTLTFLELGVGASLDDHVDAGIAASAALQALGHLGLWAPQHAPKREPALPAPDPPGPSKHVLTYHSVPDIA
jgi:hypothetical protein